MTGALLAAGHGALSTGLPGPVLIAGGIALVAAGIAIGLGIARVDRRNYDLEVTDNDTAAAPTAPVWPSNVVVLADVTGDDQFAPDTETAVVQALDVANDPVQPALRAITGGVS